MMDGELQIQTPSIEAGLRPWVIPAAVGLVSLTAGAIGGYFLGKMKRDIVYVASSQMQEVLDTYKGSKANDIEHNTPLGTATFVKTEDGLEAEIVLNDAGEETYAEAQARIAEKVSNAADRLEVARAQKPGHLDLVKDAENRDIRQGVNNRTRYDAIRSVPTEAEVRKEVYDAARAAEEEGEPVPEEVKPTRHNIFQTSRGNDTWDYDTEVSQRSKDAPYVIHKDEFDADEKGYQQTTLTYYAQDDVIADTLDVKLGGNWRALLGELKFGHGSDDPKIVYIRNEQTEMEYEVCFTNDSYEQEHGGLIYDLDDPNELQHSHRRVLKFRQDD